MNDDCHLHIYIFMISHFSSSVSADRFRSPQSSHKQILIFQIFHISDSFIGFLHSGPIIVKLILEFMDF
jgi:hypothetical protein